MPRWLPAVLVIALLVTAIAMYVWAQSAGESTPHLAATSVSCRTDGILPDAGCTPGAVDPRVTQDNVHSTICVSGYTSKVRPPSTYTDALKVQQIKEYGYTDTNPSDYEEDHLIPLELGGSPTDARNLWPEPRTSSTRKDAVENLLHRMVCDGAMTLAAAQAEIAANWQTAG